MVCWLVSQSALHSPQSPGESLNAVELGLLACGGDLGYADWCRETQSRSRWCRSFGLGSRQRDKGNGELMHRLYVFTFSLYWTMDMAGLVASSDAWTSVL